MKVRRLLWQPLLVFEVPHPGEEHRDAALVRLFD